MMKTKSTKRALLLSALSLLMCVSMLIGSTFAWFTDSVTSGSNIIKSGNLIVDLVDADGVSLEGETLEFVDENGNVLSNILWEPGCTYTLEKVYVENKGNLALKYEIVISGLEGDAKLLEAIEWDVKGAELNGYLLPGEKTEALEIIGHMLESAGNEYQGLEADGISITVYATQYNYEKDSFGPDYDKVAPHLVWDGTVDTSWYNADATSYELSSPAKLAGLAKLVNEGNSFAGKTIKLAADMDLNNLEWTTIGIESANFSGEFYGNGFKIYNLNVSGTVGVGLIGYAMGAHIEGVYIVGANVIGENSVGAVLGYGYLAKDCLKYCTVEDAVVYAAAGSANEDGDKVGAVAGWTSNGNIIGNKAENCEIYGCRDMGGIVGYVNGENRAVEVSGNTVENVTVSVIKAEGYDENKLGSNVNNAVGRIGTDVAVKSNSGEIAKNVDVTVASTSNELKNSITNNAEVILTGGEFSLPSLSGKEGVTLIGSAGTVIGGESASTGFGSNFGKNTTIKNVTFSGSSNGVRWSYAQGGTSVFENCTFAGDSTYGFHIDESHGATFIFNNCTFIGFNAFAGDLEMIEFNNCTFLSNGSYGNTNVWNVAYYNNCTWGEGAGFDVKAGTEIYVDGVRAASNATSLTEILSEDKDLVLMKDISFTGVASMPDRNNYVEVYGNKTGFAQYGGVLDGNGKTLTDSEGDRSYVLVTHGGTIKNLTIKNGARGIVTYSPTEDVIIDNVVVDGAGYALNSTEHAAVNMKISNSTINGWTSLAGFKAVTLTNCKLGENSLKYWQGMGYDQDYDRLFRVYSPTTFTKCEFEQGYYLDMSAGGTATLIDCTVNGVEITAENYADYITIELPGGKTLADCVTFG